MALFDYCYDKDGTPNFKNGAFFWYGFGFSVIPVLPGTKKTGVKWDPWLGNLSPATINGNWTEHPEHEVGFILGENDIVLDSDTPVGTAALYQLEDAFDATPKLVVKTSKGEHHYFRLATGTVVRNSSHCTEKHPERIDVKARRSMVILPPSTGKELRFIEADNVGELTEVGQDFVDAVFAHNGQQLPRLPSPRPEVIPFEGSDQSIAELEVLLNELNPDESYDTWTRCGMALYNETGGSEEGYRLWDDWSAKGLKYKGQQETWAKWKSFGSYTGDPVTLGSLTCMVAQQGVDVLELLDTLEPQFEEVNIDTASEGQEPEGVSSDGSTVGPDDDESEDIQSADEDPFEEVEDSEALHPLGRHSLKGHLAEMKRDVAAQVHLLGQIVLMGQYSVIYAAPNTGKTLLVLFLLIDSIKAKRVRASDVYYINVDDDGPGLVEKIALAEQYGFHIIAPGFRDFTEATLVADIEVLISSGQAKGTVIILDTLKKFTDLMDKTRSSGFSQIIRKFVLKGGTLIALAHVNKKRDARGKVIHAGTTDIIDDADCAYLLDEVSTDKTDQTRTVEFENVKRRGYVANRVAYSYSIAQPLSYPQLLASVVKVDDIAVERLKHSAHTAADQRVVDAVISCITVGHTKKMELVKEVALRASVSHRDVIGVLDRYTGSDPATCRWAYTVGQRGAKIYTLLAHTSETSA
jgi:hypothetical protein